MVEEREGNLGSIVLPPQVGGCFMGDMRADLSKKAGFREAAKMRIILRITKVHQRKERKTDMKISGGDMSVVAALGKCDLRERNADSGKSKKGGGAI